MDLLESEQRALNPVTLEGWNKALEESSDRLTSKLDMKTVTAKKYLTSMRKDVISVESKRAKMREENERLVREISSRLPQVEYYSDEEESSDGWMKSNNV